MNELTSPATLGGAATLGTGAASATLGATDPAPAAAPATDNPNVFTFRIPNTETDIGVDIGLVPPEVRMDFLKKGLRDYITNASNQAKVRETKANSAFDAYDEAVKADALQTVVPKPEGERTVADLLTTAATARKRLYDGEVRKQGDGTATTRQPADPLNKLVTEAVVRELFAKNKESTPGYKYTDATKAVSTAGGGIKYLEQMIAEKTAAGADEAVLKKFMNERYLQPAQMMLGQRDTKGTKDQSLLG